jgi:hypothetical protein
VLAPGEVSKPVLLQPLVGCDGWAAVKNCITIHDVAGVPAFVEIRTIQKEPVGLRVRVSRREKAKARIQKIRISRKKPRAIRLDAIVDMSEVKRLQRRRILKLTRIAPLYVPSSGSYGYEDDFYICDKCGRPIVFRGSPPTPIHV